MYSPDFGDSRRTDAGSFPRRSGRFPRRSRQPHCAEPFDLQDVPLLGYDGAPSTQRHLTAGRRRLDRR